MNNTICFSLKTATKHVNVIRGMFKNGTTYFAKLNSNLTPTSRAVRKTILTYMLQDNIISSMSEKVAIFNAVVDDPLLAEWTKVMHSIHCKNKKIIKQNKKAATTAGSSYADQPALTFTGGGSQLPKPPVFDKPAEPRIASVEEQKAVDEAQAKHLFANGVRGSNVANNYRCNDTVLPTAASRGKEQELVDVMGVQDALAKTDKDGEHSIQKTCDVLNGRPAISVIHDEVEDLVFLSRKEAEAIRDVMNSFVDTVNHFVYDSNRDPVRAVFTKGTIAGRLASMTLAPLVKQL